MSFLPPLPRRAFSSPQLPANNNNMQHLFRHTERVIAAQLSRVRAGYEPFVHAEAVLVVSKTENGEEAAVFIMTPASGPQPPEILYVIPIVRGFKHNLEQTPPSPSTSFFQQSAKPHITLYLSCQKTKVELRIASNQSAKVQKLVAELRRWNELAHDTLCPTSLTHAWCDLYPLKKHVGDDAVDDLEPDTEALTPTTFSESSETPTIVPPSLSTPSTPSTTLVLAPDLRADSAAVTSTASAEPNPYSPTFSRSTFLRTRLFASLPEWTTPVPLKIRCASYNVNDKTPPPGTRELAGLVGDGAEDLIVVGLQEADLRGQALLISQGNTRATNWESALFNGLADKADQFEKLVMTQYVGVVLIILVRKTMREFVSRVETSQRGIGLLGFGGNKAGVAVRMKIHDTTLCFVNSHLAAFTTALERRRADFTVLRNGLTFSRPAVVGRSPAEGGKGGRDGEGNGGQDGGKVEEKNREGVDNPVWEEFWPEMKDKMLSLDDCNVLFWLGDLNYRIDLPDADIRKLVEGQDWEGLLERDQLKGDVKEDKSFGGFEEGVIGFAPTFKYVHGSSTYDTKRSPSYTDRILFSTPSPNSTSPTPLSPAPLITPSKYTSHPVLWSDHRPVSCVFDVMGRKVDKEQRAKVGVRVGKELDRLEWAWRPSLTIEVMPVGMSLGEEDMKGAKGGGIDFGRVGLREQVVRKVMLRNEGKVPAEWSFRRPGMDKPICKPFIWPYPSSGAVQPEGEMVVQMVLEVDEVWAGRLTLGSEDVNDVLVLQIEGGKDTFLPITSTWAPSCVGIGLEVLSRLRKPIGEMELGERKELVRVSGVGAGEEDGQGEDKIEQGTEGKEGGGFKVVKEVWRLLEHLMSSPPLLSLWMTPNTSLSSFYDTTLPIISALSTNSSLPLASSPHDDTNTDGEVEAQMETQHKSIIDALMYLLSALPDNGMLPEQVKALIDRGAAEKEGEGCFGVLEGVGQVVTNILIGLVSVVRLSIARELEAVEAEQGKLVGVEDEDENVEEDKEADGGREKSGEEEGKVIDLTPLSPAPASIPPPAPAALNKDTTESPTVTEIKAQEDTEIIPASETKGLDEEGGVFELGDDEDDDDELASALDAPESTTVAPTPTTTSGEKSKVVEKPSLQPPAEIISLTTMSASPAKTNRKGKGKGRKHAKSTGAASFATIQLDTPVEEEKKELGDQTEAGAEVVEKKREEEGQDVEVVAEEEGRVGAEDAPRTKAQETKKEEEKEEKQKQEVKQEKEVITTQLVDVLIPAVFGRIQPTGAAREKRRSFIRMLLEG